MAAKHHLEFQLGHPPKPAACAMPSVAPRQLTWNVQFKVSACRVPETGSATTVTIAVQVFVFALRSVTVMVTVLAPALTQVNADWLRVVLLTPQLSVLPLFTAAAVVLPLPKASRFTVTAWQSATGATLSTTEMVKEHVPVCAEASVAV